MIAAALPLLTALMVIARVHGFIRWPWWLLTAPVWLVPVLALVVGALTAGALAGGVVMAVELWTGKRASFWNEGVGR